ncbi:hypothetical protein RI367_004638 [Sorochytrium milnesiophthora]
MGVFDFFSNSSNDNYDQVYNGGNQGSFTHEAIAGAAGFEAMKTFEKHARENGQPENHGFAKEMLAGVASAEVDKLFETKGLDYLDREEAKRQAIAQAQQYYSDQYM